MSDRDPIRVGVQPSGRGAHGGIFQYGLSLLDGLTAYAATGGLSRRVVLVDRESELPLDALAAKGWEVVQEPTFRSRRNRLLDPARRLVGEGRLRKAWRRRRGHADILLHVPDVDVVEPRPELEAWFRRLGVDLMIYSVPTPVPFQAGVPYILAVHDLQHRLQPEFPEVSANGEWEWREHVFRHGTQNALLVLADSETSKEDILTFYGDRIDADRIKILPLEPPPYLSPEVPEEDRRRVRERYALPERYFFYPAQFWPHKNHINLVEALGVLARRGLRPHLAFAGSTTSPIRQRAYDDVVARARELGLEENVHFLGYVAQEDMPALYAEAVALAMPTYFGPSNIPPTEAWTIGCPVLTSDIRGIREHSGDAALLVDPRSPEAIAEGLRRLWEDDDLRADLVERGTRWVAAFSQEDYLRRVAEIMDEAAERLAAS